MHYGAESGYSALPALNNTQSLRQFKVAIILPNRLQRVQQMNRNYWIYSASEDPNRLTGYEKLVSWAIVRGECGIDG